MSKYLTIILLLMVFGSHLFGQAVFKEKSKVVPSDRTTLDFFGTFLDMSGDVAMICSLGTDTDENGENPLETAGAVYAYENVNGNWDMMQKLVPSDRNSQDVFGSSVAVSGTLAVIGAVLNRTDLDGMNNIRGAGAAFIFEKDAQGIWIEKQKAVASDRAEQDNFGSQVSVSGERIAVSSLFHNSRQGAVYIFEKDGNGQWNETAKLVADDAETGAAFGFSIDLEGDYLVVGAQTENDDANNENYQYQAGAVYFFERNESGEWNQAQKIVPDDRSAGDLFGYSLDIEGSRLVVGAPLQDKSANGYLNNAGAAYLFHKDENGYWSQTQKIEASDRSALDNFGNGVSLSEDLLVVGAPDEDENRDGTGTIKAAGSVYIFQADMNGQFSEIQKVVTSDRMEDDKIGRFSSIKMENKQLVIGSFAQDLNEDGVQPLSNAGAVYFFELTTEILSPIISIPSVQYGQTVEIDLSPDPDDVFSTDQYRFVSATNGQVHINDEQVATGSLFDPSAQIIFRSSHAGNASISFSKLSGANESSISTHEFQVMRAPLTIKANDQTKSYGEVDPDFTFEIKAGLLLGTDVISGDLARDIGEDAGTYSILQGNVDAGSNYIVDFAEGTLVINKAQTTIELDDLIQEADGTIKEPTVITEPSNLSYSISWDAGSTPTRAGNHNFTVTVKETNYEGEKSGTLKLIQVLGLTDTPVNVYPNPTQDYLVIETNEVLQAEVLSLDGKQLLQGSSASKIDLSLLPNGIHLLRLTNEKGETKTFRFVKRTN
ncbi:MBG domain-containing protein [Ekhidna sp.]